MSVRDAAPGMAWVVRSVLEPGATGRPCLLIESGDRCQSARAEAFDVP